MTPVGVKFANFWARLWSPSPPTEGRYLNDAEPEALYTDARWCGATRAAVVGDGPRASFGCAAPSAALSTRVA